jgi:hypothetical protein
MSALHVALALTTLIGASVPSSASEPRTASQESQEARSPDDALDDLVTRFEERQKEFFEAYRAAKTDEERKAAFKLQPGADFAAQFRALAESAPKRRRRPRRGCG